MRIRETSTAVACAVLWAVLAAGPAGQGGQNPEELARRHYELGLGFIQTQKYTEALKDFQTVVDSYPTSSVAGDALVEIAKYHLEVARDPAAAQATTDIILKKYASTEAAPLAYVLSGRIALEKGRTPADIDTALASFERVPGLFPASDAVPPSIYYAGEALRLVRRNDEALERYREVTLKYRTSVWAARALVSAATCLTQTGRPLDAMEGLQRVRTLFAGTPEATTALGFNTVLYRLYIRAPAQPPYGFSGRMLGNAAAKFKDVAGIAVDRQDNVMLAHKTAVAVFDPKGTQVRSIPANNPSAILLSERGAPVIVHENVLTPESAAGISLTIPQPDGKAKSVDDVPAAGATSRGEWLVSDRKSKAILLFSAAGKYVKPFATIVADRLAVNVLDDVAVLDRDTKTITVLDRDGKTVRQVAARGAGYELENPVDVAFDAIGHLYVLDRDKGAVFVFGVQGKLVASFTIPEKSPGAFQKAVALGLDSAARLYIFDDRAQHVQIYQ